MDDPFAMTTDINGKPVPAWQLRLEEMYTDSVPFGEILSYVRSLVEERDIAAILSAPDDVILADFEARGGDPDQNAAEMRGRFDAVARLVNERDALLEAAEQAHRALLERTPGSVPGGEQACEVLRAAIAKARGT
jgi:hypothetical protein